MSRNVTVGQRLFAGHLVTLGAAAGLSGGLRWVFGGLYARLSEAGYRGVTGRLVEALASPWAAFIPSLAAACLVVGMLSARRVGRELRELAAFAESIAGGDLCASGPPAAGGEVGRVARSLREIARGPLAEGRSLKAGIPGAFFCVDRDLRLTYVSEAAGRLMGRPPEQVVGRSTCREALHTDLCGTGCPVAGAMSTGSPVTGRRAVSRRPGGAEVSMLVNAAPVRNAEGDVVGGFVVGLDLTERERAEVDTRELGARLVATCKELSDMGQQTSRAVGEMTQAIQQVASGSREQTQSVGETQAALSDLVGAIRRISGAVEGLLRAADQTAELARSGREVVRQNAESVKGVRDTVASSAAAVRELGTYSEQIGSIVQVIDDISGQTNLLALNAAIEAARAAEHGRGFAVVADEVRKLAESSSRSAKSIAELIQTMQHGIRESAASMESGSREAVQAASLAERTEKALESIQEAVQTTLANIQHIQESVSSIQGSGDRITRAFQEVAAVADENAAATEQVSASAQQLNAATQQLAANTQQVADSAEQMVRLAPRL